MLSARRTCILKINFKSVYLIMELKSIETVINVNRVFRTHQTNLVYIHIGLELPDYIYDSIYQTLLINDYKTKIYVILDDNVVEIFNKTISKFNHNLYTNNAVYYENVIQVIPISLLDNRMDRSGSFNNYKRMISERFSSVSEFRSGFWITTTARFYYISALMEMFSLENVFHIENDIMLYESTCDLYKYICEYFEIAMISKICMVQDSVKRVIPSILFFPNSTCIDSLTQYITVELNTSQKFINDMDILGSYEDKLQLPFIPQGKEGTLFDGAAIGQYLGGVDYKNLNDSSNPLTKLDNPSRGFVNETSLMKPDNYTFITENVELDHLKIVVKVPCLLSKSSVKVPTLQFNNKQNSIANLHIHSKQLYQFSSIFDIKYADIITGDRILGLCDFVILTRDIYNFHRDIDKYAKDVIIIRDFLKVNIDLLNGYFKSHCEKKGVDTVKLFVYTHILDAFQKYIFPYLDKSIHYILYVHNSDHVFDDSYSTLINSPNVKHIYAQNINLENYEKLSLLPIGIANSMWPHGDLVTFYTVMAETYKFKKSHSIYVNINPNTYAYRREILESINRYGHLEMSSGKPYVEYLRELANNRFCLCIRGNGVDTHRLWESLYLGVIPVIINNKNTNMDYHVKYLKDMGLPYYEIKDDDLDYIFKKYVSGYFDEILYKKIIQQSRSSIYNIESLKLNFFNN